MARRFFSSIVFFLCGITAAHTDFVPGQVLLKLSGDPETPQFSGFREALKRLHGEIQWKYSIVHGLNLVSFPESEPLDQVIAELQKAPGVTYAEPNYFIWALGTVDAHAESVAPPIPSPVPQPIEWIADPRLSENYGVLQNGTDQVWTRYAWKGTPKTIIAVLDTGIDYTHPDLVSNLWRNPDSSPSADGAIGWDFVHGNALPYDDFGHGTHVSGIAAAVGGNGIGIAGQCPRCSLMAVKVMDANGKGNDAWAIAGLEYAMKHGASVINSSWGETEASQSLYEAFAATSRAGIVNAVAAGNSGWDLDFMDLYPAKFALPGLIAVAALTSSAVIPSWSNYGPRTVPLSSAGDAVLSTVPDGKYALGYGTSMATPNISGCAALIRSYRPDLTGEQVVQLFHYTVSDPSSARMTAFGGRPDMPRIFSQLH